MGNAAENMKPRGKVEIFTTRGKPKILTGNVVSKNGGVVVYDSCSILFQDTVILGIQNVENIIVNAGKDAIINSLVSGNIKQIGRMAIGDRGTLPADPTSPKVPDSTFTTLYNEVYRADCDDIALDVGGTNHKVQFIKTFSAIDIPIASFSNQANPVVNEVGLILFSASEGELPRSPVYAPNSPPTDEVLFSIRTFKSVPFEAANEISVTIRYTVFIE